jgi:hypothetical protein
MGFGQTLGDFRRNLKDKNKQKTAYLYRCIYFGLIKNAKTQCLFTLCIR